MFYVVGLGNPGTEYENTRHNTGRMAVEFFGKKNTNKNVKIVLPDTFMNHSGKAVAKFIKSKKAAQNLIIVHDDLDLPLGTMKISYNKGTGGHRGLDSVVKAVKTREFTRLRIGISPVTPGGKIKKPAGEKAVLDFILAKFKPSELEVLKKIFKKTSESVQTLVSEGRERAMNVFN